MSVSPRILLPVKQIGVLAQFLAVALMIAADSAEEEDHDEDDEDESARDQSDLEEADEDEVKPAKSKLKTG